MKKMTNNPEFEYEISCDQMCGSGHYTMKGIVKVVSPEEFILWKAKQQSNYSQVFPPQGAPAAKDSTKPASASALPTKDAVAKASLNH